MKYINCNLCNQNNVKILEIDKQFKVVKCKSCGLIYVNPQAEEATLFNHYNQEYFAPWLGKQFIARKKMWRKRLKKIQRFKKTGKLLDVGCGTSLFLNEARCNGWDVYGTEISNYAVGYAKNAFGLEIFKGKLKDANFADDFFDIITFWHILEHTTDPLSNLIEAKRILKPNGLVIIAVPNANSIIYNTLYTFIKFHKPKLFSVNDREINLYHFSSNTLKKMIEKALLIPVRLDMDRERIASGEYIIDTFAWIIYKILRVNFGMALEIYAKK